LGSYTKNVLGGVLTVRISGNQSDEVWKCAQKVIYSGLERSAFSKIHGIANQVNASDSLDLAEPVREFRAAAIVDNDNRASVRLR